MEKHKHGDGSIRLRKDGRWEGRYVIGKDDNGYPKTKNVLARTKAECEAKLKALRESIAPPASKKQEQGITFGAWLDRWYHETCKPRIALKTQADYENRIYQHIIPTLGDIPLCKLTSQHLQNFYAQLKQNGRLNRVETDGPGLSDRMVRCCHVTCRMALEDSVKQGLLAKNPAIGCTVPSVHPKEMQILKADEIQRLLIQAKEDGCFELLLLDLSTGLRRGELCALQWDDLDPKTGELRIQRQVQRIKGQLVISAPKTKTSVRSILLPLPILKVLLSYRQTVDSVWIFPSPKKTDSPRDPTAVRKKLSATLKRASCKHVRFHDLRHTFATNALEHGMDIKTLSTIIGHVSSATTLNVYAHVTDEMKHKAALNIDKGIARVEPPLLPAAKKKPPQTDFRAVKGKYRKPGTGCITQISDRLWEGRYSPRVNGKRLARNVYAHSEEECERKLVELIARMKVEIAEKKGQFEQVS